MKIFEHKALVIGSGCAGYNCADCLYEYGVKDVAIVTEGRNMGTSRNTGSDKQTYYKLSLAGDEGDSVYGMAQTLFSGGAVDGEIALCEAANSVAGFMKLVGLGMRFPTNEYGEYVGYKTDHDPFRRATSIGPYTSKKMTEVLERSVQRKNIPVYDNCQAIRILRDGPGVVGVLALNVFTGERVAFRAPYVVLATGGPAAVYADSVYPECHTGSSALAIDAGAEFINLSEWQYGLASVDFRWNVSGTYQQVLPRYISVDEKGTEREFLTEHFQSAEDMLANIFLKGYEWPFDVRKIHGSSYIDLLVYRESVLLGRKVYLDFTREPSGLEEGFSRLGETAREYLRNSGALILLPIRRLKAMNPGAAALYAEHGIDLEKQPLRIAVCAQHCNGGVRVDENWQTSIGGLYACGEAAGTFGIFRPGGTALNSTQVGSLRAARHIAFFGKREEGDFDGALAAALAECDAFEGKTKGNASTLSALREEYQRGMSENFAFLRDIKKMQAHLSRIKGQTAEFSRKNKWKEREELFMLYKNREILLTQELIGEYMLHIAGRFGSRGSAFVTDGGDFMMRSPLPEKEEGRGKLVIAKKQEDGVAFSERAVHPIPERELWFEKAWNRFNAEIGGKI